MKIEKTTKVKDFFGASRVSRLKNYKTFVEVYLPQFKKEYEDLTLIDLIYPPEGLEDCFFYWGFLFEMLNSYYICGGFNEPDYEWFYLSIDEEFTRLDILLKEEEELIYNG